MKTLKILLAFVFLATIITSCRNMNISTPIFNGNNPYAPQPGDNEMQKDQFTIDSSSLSVTKSDPPQVMLNFAYFPPTPCHQLRIQVGSPDSQNRIDVTAYSLVEKDKPCALMALATPLDASLNLGSFPKGHYSLWLNGIAVGEFDS